MNFPKKKLPNLTPSQFRSAVTGTLALLATLNQHWPQIAGLPGLHIPYWLTAAMQVVGIVVPMMSRSLDRSRSGTGGGIVGDAPDKAAENQAGAESAPAAGAAPFTVASPFPAPAELVTGLLHNPKQTLLAVTAEALSPAGLLEITADALRLAADQHQAKAETAKTAEATLMGASRADLLKGIAAKADASAAADQSVVVVSPQAAPASLVNLESVGGASQ